MKVPVDLISESTRYVSSLTEISKCDTWSNALATRSSYLSASAIVHRAFFTLLISFAKELNVLIDIIYIKPHYISVQYSSEKHTSLQSFLQACWSSGIGQVRVRFRVGPAGVLQKPRASSRFL